MWSPAWRVPLGFRGVGILALPGLYTLLPRGPPTLLGTKYSRDAGGAFPSGAAISFPSEHLDGFPISRLARSGGSLGLLACSQPRVLLSAVYIPLGDAGGCGHHKLY